MDRDLTALHFLEYCEHLKFVTSRCVSMTPSVSLLGGWALLNDLACIRDSASIPAWVPGRR